MVQADGIFQKNVNSQKIILPTVESEFQKKAMNNRAKTEVKKSLYKKKRQTLRITK